MSGNIPEKDRPDFLAELQAQGREIATEPVSAQVPFDALVHTAFELVCFDEWEIPSGEIGSHRHLMLAQDRIYLSKEDRTVGREVDVLSEKEIAAFGAALAIQQRLRALKAKHNIFAKSGVLDDAQSDH